MAPSRYVRYGHVVAVTLAILCHSIPSIGIAERVKVRCWQCGNVFSMPEHSTSADCPACRAACKLSRGEGSLTLHCVDSGSKSCAFILRCPDRSTIVFTGSDGANGLRIVGYLNQIGTGEIAALIGSRGTRACMQSLVGIMKQFPVTQFFDPGFKGGGAAYTDYLDMLHRQDVNYRVVRSMESVSFGAAKLYVMRPSSFGVDGVDGKALSLCVVHGDNSFLLSGGLHGEAATFRNSPGLSATQIPRMLFEGASAPLKAVGSFFGRGGAIVLESNGREIGVRSLRQITVSPSHDPDSSAALGTLLTTSTKASVPAGARKAKININTASVSELDKLDGIGPKKAATVVEFRKKHGPFRTIEDIQKVPGIGEKLFERNRDRMCVR